MNLTISLVLDCSDRVVAAMDQLASLLRLGVGVAHPAATAATAATEPTPGGERPAAARPAVAAGSRLQSWSPERVALLGVRYGAGDHLSDITAALNQLHGQHLSIDAVARHRSKLGLHRSRCGPARDQAVAPARPADPLLHSDAPAPTSPSLPPPDPPADSPTPPLPLTPSLVQPTTPVLSPRDKAPVRKSYGEIQQWAIEHSIGSATHGFDLATVNQFRVARDLPPFVIARRQSNGTGAPA